MKPEQKTTPMLKVGDKVTVASEDWMWKPYLPHLGTQVVKSTRKFPRWLKVTLDDGSTFDQRHDGHLPDHVRIYDPAHEAERAAHDAKRQAAGRVDKVLSPEKRRLLLALTPEELNTLADKLGAAAASGLYVRQGW